MGQWKIHSENSGDGMGGSWIREHAVYTLFFWTPKMGEFHDDNSLQLEKGQMRDYSDQIRQYNYKKGIALNVKIGESQPGSAEHSSSDEKRNSATK